ncbi:Zinc finger, RING-H2-type [Kalmanozyma brasiliensis GHG001]|uniref:Zinc finger, RING-H2-type n=1 Tax=Kalmanozyma brasiliensis (strain GHG001) TaxID=1365824 RepID=UPI0028680D2B|nr:Zinc finger, RING-H2-type [Kalmanozyma brasiliensis GHG001]KAF6766768.1 Zinc finger, RING-H2-type [Kalmanozyma brasiliensis GHG001]
MLPSLNLSSSSLDQFRKNIYRPRLCLLLLLILLSPYNKSQLTSSSDTTEVSVSEPAQSGWAVSIIDGLVVAAAPSASSSALPKPSAKSKKASQSKQVGPSSAPSPPNAKKGSSSAEDSSAQQGQPPPGSLFRFPKLSWALLVDEHVLPAMLPLHLLWAIRLAGMAVEDGLVKSSLLGSKSRFYSVTLPLIYLSILGILAVLVGQPGTVAAITSRCYDWRSKLGYESLSAAPAERVRGSIFKSDGLLPLSFFVTLEMASTLIHLLCILPKVDATSIASILPMQLQLPSPSHLPPIVEMLPIPSFVKAALTQPVTSTHTARYARNRRPFMPSLNPTAATGPADISSNDQQPRQDSDATATATAVEPTNASPQLNRPETNDDALPQQVYRRIGAPENEVLRSTSVARPIAPLRLPENDADSAQTATSPSASGRRRAPRMRGQSVLVSTKWISETATSLFDKIIGTLIYSIITLRLPTLSPTSLPPVLSLLSLRSELASMTQIWSRARSSVECLEFVRRRWGVQLDQSKDPYTSVTRPRAAAAAGDYQWKSYDDVYCAICFEQTRSAAAAGGANDKDDEKASDAKKEETQKFEFCRLDCGHELHDVCLVSWLTAQAFCPTCHVVLSFSPRAATSARRTAAPA